MNVDDDLGFAQTFRQSFVFAAKLLDLFGRGVGVRFEAAGSRGETLRDSGNSLPPPMGEMGGVKTLPPKKSADGASACGGIGFGQNLFL